MRAVKVAIASMVLGTLAVLVAGCGGADPEAAKTPTDAITITNGDRGTDTGGAGGNGDEAALPGKAIFEEHCQGCHPAGGTAAGVGPNLTESKKNPAEIHKQIEEGSGSMPGGIVSGQDLEDVTAYVASLNGTAEAPAGGGATTTDAAPKPTETTGSAPAPTPTPAAGDVAAGKTFFEATCQGCHPAGGTTAGAGPALKGIGWTPEQIEKQVVNGGGIMPGGLASGSDLSNVVAYVSSLQ